MDGCLFVRICRIFSRMMNLMFAKLFFLSWFDFWTKIISLLKNSRYVSMSSRCSWMSFIFVNILLSYETCFLLTLFYFLLSKNPQLMGCPKPHPPNHVSFPGCTIRWEIITTPHAGFHKGSVISWGLVRSWSFSHASRAGRNWFSLGKRWIATVSSLKLSQVRNMFFMFHPENGGKYSNLTCAYFFRWVGKNHQLV